MTECTCRECGSKFEGHGNRRYCDACLTVTCASCGKTHKLAQISHKAKDGGKNYCDKDCMKNDELRSFVAASKLPDALIARKFSVSRQRVHQLRKELAACA